MKYIKMFENFNEGGKISKDDIERIRDNCFLELIDIGFKVKLDQISNSFEIKIEFPDQGGSRLYSDGTIYKNRIIYLSEIKDEILSSISFIESEFINIKFEFIECVNSDGTSDEFNSIEEIEQASEDEHSFFSFYISFRDTSNTN